MSKGEYQKRKEFYEQKIFILLTYLLENNENYYRTVDYCEFLNVSLGMMRYITQLLEKQGILEKWSITGRGYNYKINKEAARAWLKKFKYEQEFREL